MTDASAGLCPMTSLLNSERRCMCNTDQRSPYRMRASLRDRLSFRPSTVTNRAHSHAREQTFRPLPYQLQGAPFLAGGLRCCSFAPKTDDLLLDLLLLERICFDYQFLRQGLLAFATGISGNHSVHSIHRHRRSHYARFQSNGQVLARIPR